MTVSSTETGYDKYADAWEVGDDDVVLGTRTLAHPHVNEQPFTQSVSGVVVPEGVENVVIAARIGLLWKTITVGTRIRWFCSNQYGAKCRLVADARASN